MVKTIGNPLSWVVQTVGGAAEHVTHSVETIGSDDPRTIEVQDLDTEDLRDALRKGVADFSAARADVMFVVLLYPVIGVVLAAFGLNADMLPLIFPLAAGFALLGPLAAVGLYEISRRRERGEAPSWGAALSVVRSPNFGAIVVLGLYLLVLFFCWMLAAGGIYRLTLGPESPASVAAFVSDVFTTPAGWTMIVVGVLVGFLFALAALAISVVSFPLLLDRKVGVPVAIATSVEVFRRNPRVVLTWGAIVAAALILGSIPAFIGLILALPILGHSTWHLYRKAVA
ncbi:DUF2189 domain-containing protein [Psychromarinibacter sp. C21-152]|uniref:DUF2189 domain-containing protein n=1 Tax=Psychromarinibacter sediminicola TaxID=3033385 RepID=A0AAE3NMQ5_9RHOB|nr:DUF2189 domain-containing protein [Psychromarinibacter sediminicola]MDF0600753.1 DUF2189 domain-containing protein [Psychromarinibacter sediminicola]